jgi:hypothetical protein
MEVIRVPDRPAYQSFYTVAGRLLFVESIDLRLGNLVERLFAGWQLTPVSSTDRPPDIRIQFCCGNSPPEVPHNLNQFEIAEGGQCYTDGADYYLALGNSLIHLQNGTQITVNLWLTELPDPGDPKLARATSFAVCAALRRFGLFELHSAGVVHPGSERGVLIIGPSGSGKSTLALQLAIAGWPYLSDDEMLLSLVDGEVEARGFRSFFAVSNATASAVGIDKIAGLSLQETLKTCFEPEIVFGSQRRLSAVPGTLFFISLNGEHQTQLNKLTQAETMTRLIRACPWATYDTSIAAANLEVLSKLARQTSAFDLLAGHDLLAPHYVSDFLSRYSGQS